MNQKALLIGGGVLLLLVLYLATRNSGTGGSVAYALPGSSPADPNVLAAQVQQDQVKGQIALASINAAGTLDAINAQSRGGLNLINAQANADVSRINADYAGQGYVEKIAGDIAKSLATIQYANTTSNTTVPSGTQTQTSIMNTRVGRAYLNSISGGTTATQTTPTTQPAQQTYQQKSKDCWWRRNVPIIGAVVC